MMSRDLVSSARLKYLTTSAQKARLVVDLIRGKNVSEALTTLRYTRKAVASDVGKTLDSAVANARVRKPDIDLDRLFVHTAFVDGGPTLKRIRPAPMGRAYRVLKRMCHVTIGLGERSLPDSRQKGAEPAQKGAEQAEGTRATSARRARVAKPGRGARAASGGRKRTAGRSKKGPATGKKKSTKRS